MIRLTSPSKAKKNQSKKQDPHFVVRFFKKIRNGYDAVDIFLHRKRTVKDTGKELYNFFKKAPHATRVSKNWFQRNRGIIGDSIMLIFVYIFLFSGLKIEWLLKEIIPIGGDVPYHYANYIDLKEILMPNWQITGWSDASFGGFTLFQSYPIFPFLLIYFFDVFVGSGVAFKTVLILGAVGLPLATYWALFQAKVARPGPIFGAVLSLAYLFHNDHFAFGGNLRSVFSGEFAHSLSILLLVIYCGFLAKAFENKKYIPHAVIFLALIGFSHPISFAVAIFLPIGFLINLPRKEDEDAGSEIAVFFKKSTIAFDIMLIGGLLFCTWAIGYHVNSPYTSLSTPQVVANSYGWGINFFYLLPKLLLPFAVLFLVMVIYYLFCPKKMSSVQAFFLWGTFLSLSFFLLKFMGFAIRFLPLVYLFAMFFVAATIGKIYQETEREKVRIFLFGIMVASIVFIFYYTETNHLFRQYQGTSGHNFIGAESRAEWKSVALTSDFLSKNFDTQTEKNRKYSYPPRIFSQFKGDLFRVTSRATLFDSLFSHSFFTTQGIWTGRQIDKEKISVEKFWKYMELTNTKIVVAPEKLAKYLEKNPYFSLIRTFDTYKIYKTNNTSNSYVVPLKKKVYEIADLREWKEQSRKWYESYALDAPFIVYSPDKEPSPFEKYDPKNPLSIEYPEKCSVQEFVQRETIDIHTNCIGRPLLIKFAYHQNWHVTGAKKIYLATPAFMIVVPEQNNVKLYYGKRPYNYISYASGILGIILLFSHTFLGNIIISGGRRFYKKHRKLCDILSRMLDKVGIRTASIYLLKRGMPTLLVLIVLLSIAFIYTNKG